MKIHPLLFGATFFCLACASLQLPLDVGLADIQLSGITLFETNLSAEVRLQNENNRPIAIEGATYRLFLNDIDVGKGVSDERIIIPRLGSALQRVTFRLDNMIFITKIQSLLESRNFSYRLEGRLFPVGGLGLVRPIQVRREGRLEFGSADKPRRYPQRDQ